MDSLTQFTLGAAIGVAVMGRRTAAWKAALWGGLCGTLPDLDAFVDHGDPVSNMTLHRGNSHSLFYLTLLSPAIAGLATLVHRQREHLMRWWLAVWLALVTHPVLDLTTVYGTQLLRPFDETPYGLGAVFIIDPLYTLPLAIGMLVAVVGRGARRALWNMAGLALSTGYLAWCLVAQQHARVAALASLQAQGIAAEHVLVTPTAFNSVLWRIVAVTPQHYHEGFFSLLDDTREVAFDRFERGDDLLRALDHTLPVRRLLGFSNGFVRGREDASGEVRISDLRMGQEPFYVFTFEVARREGDRLVPVPPRLATGRPDLERALPWLWRRLLGERLAPPR